MTFNKTTLPKYGLGLGLRRSIAKQTIDFFLSSANHRLIEWLEIVPENYIALGGIKAKRFQELLDSKIKLIPHGVNLSVGSAPANSTEVNYDDFLIQELHKLFNQINPPWFSDHLSCTRINGYYTQDLIPLPFTKEAVAVVCDHIKFLQDEFQLPFLVENPSFYTSLIKPEMSEAEFINSIVNKADCGILLDVNNIYVNAINHQAYKPLEFLDQLDLSKVVQVHIAGHLEGFKSRKGKAIAILDTHGESIKDDVYKILQELLKRTEVNAILLERDSNFPDFVELIDELTRIRKIMDDSMSKNPSNNEELQRT